MAAATGCWSTASGLVEAHKEEVALDEWTKDVAPSAELRRWYGHDPARFEAFARRYRDELTRPPASDAITHLCGLVRAQHVTLLTATATSNIPVLESCTTTS